MVNITNPNKVLIKVAKFQVTTLSRLEFWERVESEK